MAGFAVLGALAEGFFGAAFFVAGFLAGAFLRNGPTTSASGMDTSPQMSSKR